MSAFSMKRRMKQIEVEINLMTSLECAEAATRGVL